jgi:hypothetical protein
MSRKFLVPVLLPGNPTAALEAAPKQYVDAQVAAGLPAPAYAGPVRTGASTTDTTIAQFGITTPRGRHGFNVTNIGLPRIIGPLNGQDTNEILQFHQLDAGGYTSSWVASWYGPSARARVHLGGFGIGSHPAHNLWGLWDTTLPGANDYMLLRSASGRLNLNAPSGADVCFKVNDQVIAATANDAVYVNRPVYAHYGRANGLWSAAHYVAWATPAASWDGAALALHQEGYWAPQFRVSQNDGPGPALVNADSTGYGPIYASAFGVASSIRIKHDVRDARSIGLDRERIVVHHDPKLDTVPDVDVMALRPVAFRPNVGTIRPVGDKFEEWEPDTWPGLEGRRERLGLIAEEVETLIPSAVSHGAEGNVVSVDYAQITVALLAHVQHLTEEVATLRYRVAELEGSAP